MDCKVYWIDCRSAGRVGIMPRPRGGDWLDDEMKSLASQGADIVVSLLTTEEACELDLTDEQNLCTKNGMEFVSFPINDREVPPVDTKLTDFVGALRERLTGGKSIVIHRRAGIGRSSIMAACSMCSEQDPVPRVMARISSARGFPVPDTREQSEWRQSFAKSTKKRIGND
jgi:protein-tyrosine phosphatase